MIRQRMPTRHRTALVAVTAIATLGLASVAQADTLTIGLAAEATSMDPHFHNLTPNNQITQHIFDNLINQDEARGWSRPWRPNGRRSTISPGRSS